MSVRPSRRVAGLERTLIRRIFDAAPPDAINLGLGQPDLPTPAEIAFAGVAGIAAGRTGYTSTAGTPELRAAIAAAHPAVARSGDDVVVTVGSQEAMFAACAALLDPGDELLYPDPGYPAYPQVAHLLGAVPVAYPLRPEQGFRLRADDLLAGVTERTRAAILLSPSNPTGACTARDELRRALDGLAARDVTWLSDEIYSGFDYTGRFVSAGELAPDDGLVVGGLSKDLSMTGWRIGWVLGRGDVMRRITAVHQYLATCASSVSQAAALAAFGPAGRAARERYLATFRRRREVLLEELARVPRLRFAPPDGAFYAFVDVSEYGDAEAICARVLERRGVVTIPGAAFGRQAPGWVRISFAADETVLREGVRRFAAELAEG